MSKIKRGTRRIFRIIRRTLIMLFVSASLFSIALNVFYAINYEDFSTNPLDSLIHLSSTGQQIQEIYMRQSYHMHQHGYTDEMVYDWLNERYGLHTDHQGDDSDHSH